MILSFKVDILYHLHSLFYEFFYENSFKVLQNPNEIIKLNIIIIISR